METSIPMNQRFLKFNKLLDKSDDIVTWDVVVLTAADNKQKMAFEKQIALKMNWLPSKSKYLVVADPPGYKIGNGGSTLVVIAKLNEMFGPAFLKMKTLVIHAGGYSQRFPNASALGKAFVTLPLGAPLYDMMQMKLITYVDFPGKMPSDSGGMFISSSDTIEVYHDGNIEWSFPNEGITALGHPSPLDVAVTHGVFVLEPEEKEEEEAMRKISRKCRIFLHKPSIEQMQRFNAFLPKSTSPDSGELALTDSAFFVSAPVCQLLLDYHRRTEGAIKCELDAYGDFLQALGSDCDGSYVANTRNVVTETTSLVETRRQVFELLRGTPLNVIALWSRDDDDVVWSDFHHIGTLKELRHHLCRHDSKLRRQLQLERVACCAGVVTNFDVACGRDGVMATTAKMATVKDAAMSWKEIPDANLPCMMTSQIGGDVTVGEETIVEFSRIGAGTVIGRRSVVSGCCLPEGSRVPDDVFVHTVAIKRRGDDDDDDVPRRFVTVMFGVDDDMKSRCIRYDGKAVDDAMAASLWHLKLFVACKTPRESYDVTSERFLAHREGKKQAGGGGDDLFSMHDVISLKDVDGMLSWRQELSGEVDERNRSLIK